MKIGFTAVLALGALIFNSFPASAQLVVDYDLDGNSIKMVDNTGGSQISTGSCSQTYAEPSFNGANMYNEFNAVVFPVDPVTSEFWAVTLNAAPGGNGPGAAYVSISQMAANGPAPYENLADAVVSMQMGNSAPGWQSFDFTFTGDVPIFTQEDGYEVQTGDDPLNYSVEVNVDFDPPGDLAPPDVPDDNSFIDVLLAVPALLVARWWWRRRMMDSPN